MVVVCHMFWLVVILYVSFVACILYLVVHGGAVSYLLVSFVQFEER
jgi:hypothetical protein